MCVLSVNDLILYITYGNTVTILSMLLVENTGEAECLASVTQGAKLKPDSH